ncbi:MAG: DUF389 domain-containing protein [Mycoplasmatales bacterium]
MDKIRKFFDFSQNAQSMYKINEAMHDNLKISIDNIMILSAAIFIACIGLNTNSTAVIIGAMLISPIMGPLLTIAYAFIIEDIKLLKKALFRLLIYIIVALIISTIYFNLSFIKNPTEELIARTNPTIFDILIAIFGGVAGIIGITRKNHSNVIPGVAIATALMPPLCTIGYGIANLNYTYILNASILFITNAYFIILTAVIILYFMKFHREGDIEGKSEKRIRMIFITVFIIILIVTVLNTSTLITRANVEGKLDTYIYENINTEETQLITSMSIDYPNEKVILTVNGELMEYQKARLKTYIQEQNKIQDFTIEISYEQKEIL